MARNIEIKARAWDFAAQMQVAARMAGEPPHVVRQQDTFFLVPCGRLKLREFGDGTAELIQYHRPNVPGPKQSSYVRSGVAEPLSLKAALANALGVGATVTKTRSVFLIGQTRIHFDEVDGLGQFIELEVVLAPEQPKFEGVDIAESLMAKLGIDESHLLPGAYVDLFPECKPNDGAELTA